MRRFLEHAPRPPLDRAAARNFTLTNLLALPGLGTWLAGRRFAGAIQMTLAVTGFVLTAVWAGDFFLTWIRTGEFPGDFSRLLFVGLGGVTLFATGWLSSLVSGLRLQRDARAHEQRDQIERAHQ